MHSYSIYELATGEIVQTGTCAEADVEGQAGPGQGLVLGAYNPADGYVADGALVAYTPAQAAAKAAPPSPWHRWSNETMAWADSRSLDDLRRARVDAITAWRDAADRDTFEFAGRRFQADPSSQSRITAVAMQRVATGALPVNFPGFWKAEDNSYLPIPDVATWDRFYAAMFATGAANFARSERLKQAAARAKTAAELEAITWENP